MTDWRLDDDRRAGSGVQRSVTIAIDEWSAE